MPDPALASGSVSAGSARPGIAAVISTRNRAPYLARALEGFVAQSLAQSDFEVVVVDDGSTDDTAGVVSRFLDRLRLRAVRQAHSGLASARNHGLFCTTAPIVLFADDDDVPDSRLLEQHLAGHAAFPDPEAAVLGRTLLAPECAADPFMHFITEVGCFLFSYPAITHGAVLDFTYFWGGRTSCKRSFLLRHGTFDSRFRFGCEDIELGRRLSRHGLRVVYNERARTTMVRLISLQDFCRRLEMQGASNAVFSTLYPDDDVVRRWTGVHHAVAGWAAVGSAFDQVVRVALRLDQLARLKLERGLGLSAQELNRLHDAYRAVCQAALWKGTAEAADTPLVTTVRPSQARGSASAVQGSIGPAS